MEFGVTHSLSRGIEPISLGKQAEAWGFHTYWAPEFLTIPTFDPMVLLAAVAQHTSSLRLGTGVVALALRSPFQLAKAASSVDLLSGGRLTLGVGMGGVVPKDLEIEGIDPSQRGKLTDERLAILDSLLSGTGVDYEGRYYSFEDVSIEPRPAQEPGIPIWVGARWTGKIAKAALRRAARHADTFIFPADTPAGLYEETQDTIRELAASYGRNPDSIKWAGTLWTCLGETKAQARKMAQQQIEAALGVPWEVLPDRSYGLGTPEDCIESIERFAELGISHFIITQCCPPAESAQQLETFSSEVIPHFK